MPGAGDSKKKRERKETYLTMVFFLIIYLTVSIMSRDLSNWRMGRQTNKSLLSLFLFAFQFIFVFSCCLGCVAFPLECLERIGCAFALDEDMLLICS